MSEAGTEKLANREIFKVYGGLNAVLRSGYFWTAVAFMVPTWSQWSRPGWWETVIAVTPSLIGFTLGGFALMLAFGDDRFRSLLANAKEENGPCVITEMAATFWMFITVQVAGLLAAIASRGLWEARIQIFDDHGHEVLAGLAWIPGTISYFLFLYGIMLSLAATKWIYMLAVAYSEHLRSDQGSKGGGSEPPSAE